MRQITIAFDGKNTVAEKCANFLYTEISTINEFIKGVEIKTEKFEEMTKTSNDNVLYIGECGKLKKADNKSQFKDYGLEIGYRGTQAWIIPDNLEILDDNEIYKEFIKDLKDLYDKHENLENDITKPVDIVEDFGSFLISMLIELGIGIPSVTSTTQNFLHSSISFGLLCTAPKTSILDYIIRKLKYEFKFKQIVAEQQLKFATIKFYDNYLNDFLKLDEQKR